MARPAELGIIGPIPPGQDPQGYDRLRRRILWSMPAGLYLIGSRVEPRLNLMTCNWCFQVSVDPKAVAFSVEGSAITTELVRGGGVFTVSILRREDRAVVRRFVKPVTEMERGPGGEVVSMAGQPVAFATTGAPYLRQARAWLDCRVREELVVGSHTLFVGQVVDAGADDPEELDGEVLRMEDTRMSYGG